MHLQFVESESTFDYFAATRAYLERYGIPVAFYSDKHSVFRVNRKDAIGGDGMTQFGRPRHALNIDIICANSSQAKGRVERANGTLQDRLVKEMRLSGIDTIAAGNAFLPALMEQYNARFAKAPFEDRDVHRTLVVGHDDLDDAFAWKEDRTVSVNLTLQYDQVLFILEPTGIARSLARKRVTVIDYPDGRLAIRYNGVDLPYRTFDKRPQVNQAAIVENKRLGPILAYIAEQQKQLDMSRSAKAPRRRGQKNHMFKVGKMNTRASRCAIWRLHAPPSRYERIQPQAKERTAKLPPNRATFLNGPNRDFPKWRRHQQAPFELEETYSSTTTSTLIRPGVRPQARPSESP